MTKFAALVSYVKPKVEFIIVGGLGGHGDQRSAAPTKLDPPIFVGGTP